MVKVVLIAKKKNVGVKKFLVVSSKSDKVIGGAETKTGLGRVLKGKQQGTYYVIENPQVRSAYVEQIKPATLKHWRKSKEAQTNLAKQYSAVLFKGFPKLQSPKKRKK